MIYGDVGSVVCDAVEKKYNREAVFLTQVKTPGL